MPGLQRKRSNPSPLSRNDTFLLSADLAWAQLYLLACRPGPRCFKQPHSRGQLVSAKSETARSQNQQKLLRKHKRQNTPKLPPCLSQFSNRKLSWQYAHLSTCLQMSTCRTNSWETWGWSLVVNFRKHEHVLVLSSGSRSIQVFGTSVFFPGWKCAKLIINLKHTITSTKNICYTALNYFQLT